MTISKGKKKNMPNWLQCLLITYARRVRVGRGSRDSLVEAKHKLLVFFAVEGISLGPRQGQLHCGGFHLRGCFVRG